MAPERNLLIRSDSSAIALRQDGLRPCRCSSRAWSALYSDHHRTTPSPDTYHALRENRLRHAGGCPHSLSIRRCPPDDGRGLRLQGRPSCSSQDEKAGQKLILELVERNADFLLELPEPASRPANVLGQEPGVGSRRHEGRRPMVGYEMYSPHSFVWPTTPFGSGFIASSTLMAGGNVPA